MVIVLLKSYYKEINGMNAFQRYIQYLENPVQNQDLFFNIVLTIIILCDTIISVRKKGCLCYELIS